MSMKDSIAGLNPAVVIADSSCAEGQLKKRLNIWSKSLRKSNRSWKKLSRGIKFVITASWGVMGGADVAYWSWGRRNAAPAGVFLINLCVHGVKRILHAKFSWSARAGNKLADSWTLCQFARPPQGDMF